MRYFSRGSDHGCRFFVRQFQQSWGDAPLIGPPYYLLLSLVVAASPVAHEHRKSRAAGAARADIFSVATAGPRLRGGDGRRRSRGHVSVRAPTADQARSDTGLCAAAGVRESEHSACRVAAGSRAMGPGRLLLAVRRPAAARAAGSRLLARSRRLAGLVGRPRPRSVGDPSQGWTRASRDQRRRPLDGSAQLGARQLRKGDRLVSAGGRARQGRGRRQPRRGARVEFAFVRARVAALRRGARAGVRGNRG